MSAPDTADLWPDVQPEAARRLLVAAVDSFARLGYHATTTREIARTAGMSPAALYIHYPSKSALLFEISRSGHEQTMALVERAAAVGGDPVERVRALVAEFTAWHARAHTVARIVQYELQALPPREYEVVAELRRRIEATVREVIADGVDQGVFAVADVRTAARALISLGVDVARWYNERSATPPDELGRRYADLVLGMLGAPPGPREQQEHGQG
ncbi:TetR/AcrR family transcriptional regulator [Streptacidiphilus sp. PB12-B1b]|uniref:TetR/AcrR family transcriptional regulator n=1 Tax=Streptacidiphilus sp. PB12-B1b TaxID=2705012 RepID=UPI0015FC3E5C|nr:TetR/AcrR family transcriptional regulator [Streptacidiphilus sp. PB12-B1b]QMU77785.1 TetR/AcrR family transcriptional regulator [Streptacidiphilus sp. PB12-B1b]